LRQFDAVSGVAVEESSENGHLEAVICRAGPATIARLVDSAEAACHAHIPAGRSCYILDNPSLKEKDPEHATLHRKWHFGGVRTSTVAEARHILLSGVEPLSRVYNDPRPLRVTDE